MTVYYLENSENATVEYDNSNIVSSDQEGVLVECDFETASQLANEWQLKAPMYAALVSAPQRAVT